MPDPEVTLTAEDIALLDAQKAEQDKAVEVDKAALAEFQSGFADEPAVAPTPEPAPVVTVEPVVVAEEVPPVEVPEIPQAKISEKQFESILKTANSVEEIQAAFTKLQRDFDGKIGGLAGTIKELREKQASGAYDVSEQDFEELTKEYPDLTKLLVKGFNRVSQKVKPAPAGAVDVAALVHEEVTKRVTESQAQYETRLAAELEARDLQHIHDRIADVHEDWREVTGFKDNPTPYRAWLKAQGAEFEAKLLQSRNPREIAQTITKFKTFEKEKAKNIAVVTDGKNARSERLREAVPVRGGAPAPGSKTKTAQEEFAEGFNS